MSLSYDFSMMRVYGRPAVDAYGSTTGADDDKVSILGATATSLAFGTTDPIQWDLSPESVYMLLADQDCRFALLDGYHIYDLNGNEVAPGAGSVGANAGAGESPVNANRGMTLLADTYFPVTTTKKAFTLSVIGKSVSGNLEVTRMETKSRGL